MLPGKRKAFILIPLTGMLLLAAAYLLREPFKKLLFPSEYYSETPAAAEQPDSMEYAPGYPRNTISVEEQFQRFPSPQFKTGFSLMPNFLWMDPIYFSGYGQDGITEKTAVSNSVKLQQELVSHWNYYLLISSNTTLYDRYQKPGTFENEWIKLAHMHPDWKCAAISFWAQVRPQHLNDPPCNSRRAFATRKDLADSMYVMENVREKIYKRWNPANEVSDISCDIRTQQFYFNRLHQYLQRPLSIISENAEVFHHFQDEQMAENDRVKRDMKKRGIENSDQYQALKRMEWERAYRDSILKVKGNENALYTVYSIDGQNKFRHRYDIMRTLSSPIRGMHYATPDFYPRWPDNWKKWKGPWHGLDWIVKCRNTELEYGDRLFSPFVAAGWDNDESRNIRPAQWLALMKVLGVMGAEFYYTGFFNLKKPFADPRGYTWQAVIPVYAQAVLSHAEDILLEGNLINGPEYLLPTGKSNIIAVARKHRNKKHYLVATAIMVNSNEKTDRPAPEYVDIELDGMQLHLLARRQGSVYRIERDDKEVHIRQLDLWHEDSHPARWSKDLNMSAMTWEVNDIETESGKNDEQFLVLGAGQSITKEVEMTGNHRYVQCEIKVKDSLPLQLDIVVNGKTFTLKSQGGLAILKGDFGIKEGTNNFRITCKKGTLKLSEIKFIHE